MVPERRRRAGQPQRGRAGVRRASRAGLSRCPRCLRGRAAQSPPVSGSPRPVTPSRSPQGRGPPPCLHLPAVALCPRARRVRGRGCSWSGAAGGEPALSLAAGTWGQRAGNPRRGSGTVFASFLLTERHLGAGEEATGAGGLAVTPICPAREGAGSVICLCLNLEERPQRLTLRCGLRACTSLMAAGK